jgi:hypothetical protein
MMLAESPKLQKSSRVNPAIGGFRPPPRSRHGDAKLGDAVINTQVSFTVLIALARHLDR